MKKRFLKNPLLSMFAYVWRFTPRKRLLVIAVVFSLIANLIAMIEPLIIGKIFNSVQTESNDPEFLSALIKYLLLIVLIELGFWLFHGTSRLMEEKNAFLVRRNYRQEMFQKTVNLSAEWHKNHHSGDTIDKIGKASQNLFNFSSQIFFVTQNFVKLFGSITILLFFDWKATLVALAVSIFSIWTILIFDKKLRVGYKKVFRAENYLASGIHDYISNIITIVTLRLKKRVLKEIDRRSMRAYDVFLNNKKLNELKWFSTSMYITLMIVGVLIASANNSYKTTGVILVGNLFILYRYLSSVGGSFHTFAWKYGQIVEEESAMKEAEVLNREFEKVSKKRKKHYLPKRWKIVKVKNLDFTYEEMVRKDNKNLKMSNIKKVNFSFKRGQRVAFIGESGSGKSTVLSLMRGLHNPDEVVVFCDGKKLKSGMSHLNEHVLLVPQDPEIFNSTVKDNITMGISVTGSQIKKAMRLARFTRVVKRLKKGLKTNVMEKGVSLSGGEKQRLAIARGILVADKYDLILLDEPTSSVDSGNELEIYKGIFKEFKDKTIFSSIHRLHLLRYFDYIYFFQKGRLVTEGTFHELLEDDKFKVLWKNYSRNLPGKLNNN